MREALNFANYLSLTAAAHKLPPYARETLLCLFGMFLSAVGRAGLIP